MTLMRFTYIALVWALLMLPLTAAAVTRGVQGGKTKGSTSTTQPFHTVVVNGLRQSSKLEPKSLELTSNTLMLVGFVAAASSLFAFNLITEQIKQNSLALGFKGSLDEVLIFDLRNGYTVDEVRRTLSAWGHGGRWLYILVELIDVSVYHQGYRILFLVLYNKITKALCNLPTLGEKTRSTLVKLGYFPIILALLDMTEDFFQVAMTIFFDFDPSKASSGLFKALVYCASTMNQIKWRAVSIGMPLFGLSVAALAVLKAVDAVKAVK